MKTSEKTKRVPVEIRSTVSAVAIIGQSNYIVVSNGAVVREARVFGADEAIRKLRPSKDEKLYIEVGGQ